MIAGASTLLTRTDREKVDQGILLYTANLTLDRKDAACSILRGVVESADRAGMKDRVSQRLVSCPE